MKPAMLGGVVLVGIAILATGVEVRAAPRMGRDVHAKGSPMSASASGPFEVKLTPAGDGEVVDGVATGRMILDKQFHGELEATSRGEMLSVRTMEGLGAGSATYVAVERVSGVLGGRTGGFVLVHKGVVTPTSRSLVIDVAPGSGTGELTGLSGSMQIEIAEGKHSYRLDYTL
jgi:hypothetical protein